MAFAIKTTVTGAPELFKALREINKKIARVELRKAINEASKLVLKDAKAAVPAETGSLRASLGIKIVVKQDTIFGVVGPRKLKGAFGKGKNRKTNQTTAFGKSKAGRKAVSLGLDPVRYAHLVEYGTRRHTLTKGDRLGRKPGQIGKQSNHGPFHPGARPQPFLRPALDRNMNAVRTIVRMRLETALRNAGVA